MGLALVPRLGFSVFSSLEPCRDCMSLSEVVVVLSSLPSSRKSLNDPSESLASKRFFSFILSIFSAFIRKTIGCVHILWRDWKSANREVPEPTVFLRKLKYSVLLLCKTYEAFSLLNRNAIAQTFTLKSCLYNTDIA